MAELKIIDGGTETAPLDLFSYAALPREDEAVVREAAERIKLRLRRTAEDIIEIGKDLIAVKERLPHGQFLPWLREEFDMSEHTARRFMGVAREYGDKTRIVRDLEPTALYELAAPSTPQAVRDQVEELIVDGQKVTVADIRRMKQEAKAAKEGADALASRNAELAAKANAKAPASPPVDIEAIRAEAFAEAEQQFSARISELSEANVAGR